MKASFWLVGVVAALVLGCARPPVQEAPVQPEPAPAVAGDLERTAAAEVLAKEALAQARAERWEAALSAGLNALELKPDLYAAMYPVAWALLHTDRWQEAGPYLEKAQPGAGTYRARGLWSEKTGAVLEAFVQYTKAGPEAKADLDRLTAEWQAKVPQGPFWGPPGTVVLGKNGRGDEVLLSQSLAPLPFGDRVLQPVNLDYVTYLAHASGARLWVGGSYYRMIGQLNINETPAPLADLPYAPGGVWALYGEGRGPVVIGFETLQTPAGTFPTVVIEEPESRNRQWWSPGVGLVKLQNRDGDVVAARVEQREPQPLVDVKQITPTVTAIIANQKIYDRHGRVLADFQHDKNEGRRPSEHWVDIGAPYPAVVRGTHSQGEPNWKQIVWAYDPGSGLFKPVPWHFPDGTTRIELVGFFHGDLTGEVTFLDEEYYPRGEYRFRYLNGAFQGELSRMLLADDAERLGYLLTDPLNRESFIRLFADPALGERAAEAVYKFGRNALTGGMAKPMGDAWVVEAYGGPVLAKYSVAKVGEEYRVIEFAVGGGLP